MQTGLRRVERIAATLWLLSWFELYLEIFRFRHVALLAVLGDAVEPQRFGSGAHAGAWLRTDLACAVIAPVLYLALRFAGRRVRIARGETAAGRDGQSHAAAAVVVLFGLVLAVLGVVNQIIWHPPLVVDLTLRRGNGGFVVLGLVVAIVGLTLPRVTRSMSRRGQYRVAR